MASRQSNTKASRQTSTRSKRTTGSRSRKNGQGSLALAIWAGLTNLYGGRILLGILASTLVIWIEALVIRKNVQLFFRTIGVEILIVLFIGWILYMIHGSRHE